MKKLFFGLIFALSACTAFAQAPYLGGQADGYASIEGHVGVIVDPPEPLQNVFIYPTRVLHRGEIEIDVFEIKNELHIRLIDVLGQVLITQSFEGISGEKRIQISTAKLAPATYWIEVLRDGEKTVKPVIVLNE